jgi:hypothetical protein
VQSVPAREKKCHHYYYLGPGPINSAKQFPVLPLPSHTSTTGPPLLPSQRHKDTPIPITILSCPAKRLPCVDFILPFSSSIADECYLTITKCSRGRHIHPSCRFRALYSPVISSLSTMAIMAIARASSSARTLTTLYVPLTSPLSGYLFLISPPFLCGLQGRQIVEVQFEPGHVYHAWYPSVTRVKRTIYTRPKPHTVERHVYW